MPRQVQKNLLTSQPLSLSIISGLSGRVMYALLAPSKPKVLSAYDVDMATHTAVKKRRQHYMLR